MQAVAVDVGKVLLFKFPDFGIITKNLCHFILT